MKSNMEIKVGDKVRVRKDAPRMYARGKMYALATNECKVEVVEDDNAVISLGSDCYTIPFKYLIKVEDEDKAKYRIGDIVRVLHSETLKGVYVYTIIGAEYRENLGWYYQINVHEWYPESDLEPYTEGEAKERKFKVGDFAYWNLVKVKIDEIRDNGDIVAYTYDNYRIVGRECDFKPCAEPTEEKIIHTAPESVENLRIASEEAHLCSLSQNIGIYDKWEQYAADLAKEVALKVANKYNDPEEAAYYAVKVAKAVVEGLKRK